VRHGAKFDAASQARYATLCERLATLEAQFTQNCLGDGLPSVSPLTSRVLLSFLSCLSCLSCFSCFSCLSRACIYCQFSLETEFTLVLSKDELLGLPDDLVAAALQVVTLSFLRILCQAYQAC
jgi:hypothetical protein